MTDLDIQDKIDRYIREEMSAEEKEAFERLLKEDKDLRAEVELEKRISAQIKNLADKRQKMAQWDKDFRVSTPEKRRRSFFWRHVYIISSAAALLIVGVFFSIFHEPTDTSSSVLPSPTLPVSPAVRSSLSIDSIMRLVDSAEYTRALEAIQALRADTLSDSRSSDADEIEYFRLVRKDVDRQLDSLERVCRKEEHQ